jgi:transcriptional regulator with XRE-family HTH domain
VKNLLVLLGTRVHELRTAKNWSQEEFAHVSGLHRTYIGQIERGEKNISFGNLLKISGVLGVTLSELLSGLEDGGPLNLESKRSPDSGSQKMIDAAHRMFEIQKLVKRLRLQRTEVDRTILALEGLAVRSAGTRTPSLKRLRARGSKR